MDQLFPVYEVGSMPKLNARVKACRKNITEYPSEGDITELRHFGDRAKVSVDSVCEILERQRAEKRPLNDQEKKEVIDLNALINLKLQEEIGLDYVYDGEARRSEMYRHCAKQVEGFENYPEMLRSRGPDSWLASVCTENPRLGGGELPEIQEFNFVKENAKHRVKVPLDDPYMIANMTGNRFFVNELRKKLEENPKELRYQSKRELTLAIARHVIRPQVEALVAAGADWIQLDIPSATIDLEHLPIMIEGINEVVKQLDTIKFSLHICYPKRISLIDKSGYELLYPYVLDLLPQVNHFSLEFANGDQYAEDLACFGKWGKERKFEIGLGVIDITLEKQQRGVIETPEQVRDRTLLAADIVGDPSLIYVAPDCGTRQLTMERAVKILDVLVEGAKLARQGV